MELHLSDGEEITCTPEHRFYVPGKGFEEAGTLSDGDRLVHDDDATSAHSTTAAIMPPLKISDITWDTKATSLSTATTVYNFEVASTHTYFVGSKLGGVWVHNSCEVPTDLGVIMEDTGYNTRQTSVSTDLVNTYINRLMSGSEPPPIRLDGDTIVDGNHRIIADTVARLNGYDGPPLRTVQWASPSNPGAVIPWGDVTWY
jgi:hypothetical protein